MYYTLAYTVVGDLPSTALMVTQQSQLLQPPQSDLGTLTGDIAVPSKLSHMQIQYIIVVMHCGSAVQSTVPLHY